MGEVYPMPTMGDVFTDVRGDGRTMRVSYHENREVIVVSLWAGATCRGSFQLAADEVTRLAALLSQVGGTAPTMPAPGDADPPTDAEASTASTPSPAPTPERTGEVHRAALPTMREPRVA